MGEGDETLVLVGTGPHHGFVEIVVESIRGVENQLSALEPQRAGRFRPAPVRTNHYTNRSPRGGPHRQGLAGGVLEIVRLQMSLVVKTYAMALGIPQAGR